MHVSQGVNYLGTLLHSTFATDSKVSHCPNQGDYGMCTKELNCLVSFFFFFFFFKDFEIMNIKNKTWY